MRIMKRTFFILAALLSAAMSLTARDFEAVTPSGHTLYCDMVAGGASIVGWDYSPDGTEPIHLVIPSRVNNGGANLNVVAIGDSAFMYCSRMVSVELPTSVRSIGRDAFNRCYGLGSIAIPSNVESIGEDAFAFIPNVEYNGPAEGAPWGALYLNAWHEGQYYYSDNQKTHIVCCERDAVDAAILPSVTSIGDKAFYSCYNITSVRIDSTISQIGIGAFGSCIGLDSVFFNPQSSGGYTFSDCISLRQITFGGTVSEIPFYFCTNCTSLENIVIPDNITTVQTDAFSGCTSLETAVVGNGLYQTGYSMFEGCTSLQSVMLSDDLQIIKGNTFKDCSNLREIILPSGVSVIGDNAFSGCGNVDRIVCMRNAVPNTGNHAFDSVDSAIEVIVPCNVGSLYRQSPQWHRFENIEEQSYYLVASSNNPDWGHAVATRQPTCENNAATVEAIPEEGCRFVKWNDNNTDNPRQISYNGEGYVYRKAIFERTADICGPGKICGVKVYSSNGNIVIEGGQGEQIWIFDIMGRVLLSKKSDSQISIVNFQSPNPGICFVKVGKRKAEKIYY